MNKKTVGGIDINIKILTRCGIIAININSDPNQVREGKQRLSRDLTWTCNGGARGGMRKNCDLPKNKQNSWTIIARCYKTQHWESPPPVWATVGYVGIMSDDDDDDDGDDDDDDDEDDEQELSDMWELCNESGHSCYCCHTVIIIFQRAQRNPLFCPLSINPT